MLSMGNETDQLKDFLNGLKSMEKDLGKMSSGLSDNLGKDFERVMNSHFFEGEKKMKINKKEAKVSLAKDGSLKIIFDNPEDGKNFYEGKK